MNTESQKKPRRRRRLADVNPGYLRGDAAAARYLGFRDPQARTFREWAQKMRIRYAMIGTIAHYRISDLDAAWEKAAQETDRYRRL